MLSLLLLPNKFGAVVYFAFAGFYPILKERLERVPGLVCLVLKLVIFNLCMLAMYGVACALSLVINAEAALWMIGVTLNLLFVVYDIALTRLIGTYLRVWRKKLKIEKWKG